MIHLLIHGHGRAQDVFDRHLPLWQRHGCPITVFSPDENPLNTSLQKVNHPYHGQGKDSSKLWELFLVWMIEQPEEEFVIFEYDSFCLSKEIQFKKGLSGVVLDNLSGNSFMNHRYCGHPLGLDKYSAAKMLLVLREYPDVIEQGYIDRMYPALASLAGIPLLGWNPRGLCYNTILPEHIQQLKDSITSGGRMFHGIKTKEMLDVCLETMRAIGEPI